MNELRQTFTLKALLVAAKLARSTFYYQLKAQALPDKYLATKQAIKEIFDHHKGRYGYRRITSTLRTSGALINHKVIQRLMGMMNLKSFVRAKKYRSYKGEIGQAAPNVLQRQFSAKGPNQKWVTDVTEFKVLNEKLYLSPILDLYNGEIVSFALSKHPVFKMVKNMLEDAFSQLKASEKPLIHSDQGWQYRLDEYKNLLANKGLIQSMSRKGNCLDNAVIENFFGLLKTECFHKQKFTSVDHLACVIKEYIHYYNNERIKLKLKGLSPVQYRIQSFGAA